MKAFLEDVGARVRVIVVVVRSHTGVQQTYQFQSGSSRDNDAMSMLRTCFSSSACVLSRMWSKSRSKDIPSRFLVLISCEAFTKGGNVYR